MNGDPLKNLSDKTVWLELHNGSGVPLIFDELIGDIVYVREADPGESTGARIPLSPGHSVAVASPVSGIGIYGSGEAGANDLAFPLRIVPVGRGGGLLFARTLRYGEPDDGRRVHVRPGEELRIEPGSLVLELDAIDDYYRSVDPKRPEGSLASALRVWLGVSSDGAPEISRLALAAARRLDAAEHLLRLAELSRIELEGNSPLLGPQVVAKVDELVHLVQEAVVASARCIAVVQKAVAASPFDVKVPERVLALAPALKAVRDAYEHIDERAFGRTDARGSEDPGALSIFDHQTLVREGTVTYMAHRVEVASLAAVLTDLRSAIKTIVGGPPPTLA